MNADGGREEKNEETNLDPFDRCGCTIVGSKVIQNLWGGRARWAMPMNCRPRISAWMEQKSG